ncbi:MAG: hypothetical protein ACI9VR_000066 [Cognaticolwellia sp.]
MEWRLRIGPILSAIVRVAMKHYKEMLKPTAVLVGAMLVMASLMAAGVLVGVLSGTDVLQGYGFWPFASLLFFLGRICTAPIEVWWLRRLQAAMAGTDGALVKVGVGEVFEAVALEAIRAPIVVLGFLMCIVPGLFLRPLLFLPESALSQGHSLRESFTMALDLMKTRYPDVVITDFLLVFFCGGLSAVPIVGPFVVLPALLLSRYILWLDLSGQQPAETIAI